MNIINPYKIIVSKRDRYYLAGFSTVFSLFFLFVFTPFGMPDTFISTKHAIHIASFGPAFGLVVMFNELFIRGKLLSNSKWTWGISFLWFVWEAFSIGLGLYLFDALQHWSFEMAFNSIPGLSLQFMWVYLLILIISTFIYTIRDLSNQLKNQKEAIKSTVESEGEKLVIRGKNKMEVLTIPASDLLYMEAKGNYIQVAYKTEDEFKKYLLRSTVREMHDRFRDMNIQRVHRSFLVNSNRIEKYGREKGKLFVYLNAFDLEIPVSEKYIDIKTLGAQGRN